MGGVCGHVAHELSLSLSLAAAGAHGRFVLRGEGGCRREARVQTLEPVAWMREVQSRGHGTRSRVVLSLLEQ